MTLSEMQNSGRVLKVAGPLVVASNKSGKKMFEVVRVCFEGGR